MALRGHLPLHLALGPQPMALRAFRHLPSPTCDETCRVETLHGRNASGCVFDQIHATQRVVAAGRRWLTQIGTRFRSRLPTANLAPQSVTPSLQACGIPPRNRPPSTTPTARRFFGVLCFRAQKQVRDLGSISCQLVIRSQKCSRLRNR